ncbi:hypothetical protein FACS1894181_04820 [Bacteroidia bacterium]|nr:hypothetical protein FACS1894181_04820 [Bacteroidia bacterium]
MERGKITINEMGVKITPANGNVWLPAWEIARLFEVFVTKVSSNIKSRLKSGVLREREVCCCHYYTNGGSVDLYNLDMIIALAYRINSHNSERFRSWLMKKAVEPKKKLSPVMAVLCDERKISLN